MRRKRRSSSDFRYCNFFAREEAMFIKLRSLLLYILKLWWSEVYSIKILDRAYFYTELHAESVTKNYHGILKVIVSSQQNLCLLFRWYLQL